MTNGGRKQLLRREVRKEEAKVERVVDKGRIYYWSLSKMGDLKVSTQNKGCSEPWMRRSQEKKSK